MKVSELIEALKKFPADMLVLTDGYETGFEEIRFPKIIEVEHKLQKPSYDGEYQDVENSDNSIKAVVIGRNQRADLNEK